MTPETPAPAELQPPEPVVSRVEARWSGYGAAGARHLADAVRFVAHRCDLGLPLDRGHVLKTSRAVVKLSGLGSSRGAQALLAKAEGAPDGKGALQALAALVERAQARAREVVGKAPSHPDPVLFSLSRRPAPGHSEAWLAFPVALEREVLS